MKRNAAKSLKEKKIEKSTMGEVSNICYGDFVRGAAYYIRCPKR